MKTKKIIITIILACIFKIDICAQEESKGIGKIFNKNKMVSVVANDSVDYFRMTIDSLQRDILLKDSIALEKSKLIVILQDNIREDSIRINEIKTLNDSLLREIDIQDNRIKVLESRNDFVDTCMVKLANRWLYERFSRKDVEDAIAYFDRIYSTQLKEELSIVQELLKNYESSYMEFQSILRGAQNDSERTNPFAVDNYKEKYKQLVKEMYYFKKYYDTGWTIIYLDEQIQKALDVLETHSKDKPADFDFLIDKDIM